jgi:hypothetical protein
MTDYRQPFDSDTATTPVWLLWQEQKDGHDNPVKAVWWSSAVLPWGGRQANVVVASAGEMYVFDRHGKMVGSAESPVKPEPGMNVFWPLMKAGYKAYEAAPYQMAYQLRDTGLMIADVNGVLGLTLLEGAASGAWHWRVMLGHVLLGFYPPMPDVILAEEWKVGVGEIGEASARRVKRALIQHLGAMGRRLRAQAAEPGQKAVQLATLWN